MRWKLQINDDSRQILVCQYADTSQEMLQQSKWRIVEEMRALGHQIGHNGSASPAWRRAKSSVWRAWRGNLQKPGYKGSNVQSARVLSRAASGILNFQMPLIPWAAAAAEKKLNDFLFFFGTGIFHAMEAQRRCPAILATTRADGKSRSKESWFLG